MLMLGQTEHVISTNFPDFNEDFRFDRTFPNPMLMSGRTENVTSANFPDFNADVRSDRTHNKC